MPRMTGLDLARAIRDERLGARVIIVTTFARRGYLRRALEGGTSGYLLKDSPAKQLAEAVRRVREGGRVIDPALATEAWGEAAMSKLGASNPIEAARLARDKGWL